MLKTPAYWYGDQAPPVVLRPLACLYDAASRLRRAAVRPYRAEKPVICIGNITAGGSGKTPVAIAVARILQDLGLLPHFLTRGYGGREKGPVLVQPQHHSYKAVGDEPLLLARHAPCWVSRNRVKGADTAIEGGAGSIVMDDGFQNPSLYKDIALLVIDAARGFGNNLIFPAGPLREKPQAALERAQGCVILNANDEEMRNTWRTRLAEEYGFSGAVFFAALHPARRLDGEKYVGFAGIGIPEKFRETLTAAGANMQGFYPFPDHHPYTQQDLQKLLAAAQNKNAALITTEKDAVRLDAAHLDAEHLKRVPVQTLAVSLQWQEEDAITSFLKEQLQKTKDARVTKT